MIKYYIYDKENNKVIKDNIPTLEIALFIENKLLKKINYCVTWIICEYLV